MKIKSKNWMIKAFVLGAVFFIAALLVKPVGVSTQFSVLSGIIHKTIDSNVIVEDTTRETGYRSSNAYYDKHEGKLAERIMHPWNYDFVFVLAIPLGGYIGHVLNKRRNKIEEVEVVEVPEAVSQTPIRKVSFVKRYFPSFLGGFLLLYGARMADGCTSGHMMSGMMQGSVSGYLFATAVFAVAIPTAIYIGSRYKTKGGER